MLKAYYQLTKPGIIYGNLITAAAGFFLASAGRINLWLLILTLLGTSLVIASACVFNNYFDREIDAQMSRTKNRGLVKGTISTQNALMFATALGIIGFGVLIVYVNLTTVIVGLIGFFDYVIFYTFSKKLTVWATLIGSVAGATPIVAGYTAVTNRFDLSALILFLILTAWQMPHFYAIATYRMDDYANAKIPVLPVKAGILATKIQILLFIVGFVIASSAEIASSNSRRSASNAGPGLKVPIIVPWSQVSTVINPIS